MRFLGVGTVASGSDCAFLNPHLYMCAICIYSWRTLQLCEPNPASMPLLEDVARVASNLGIPAEAQKGGALPVLKAACEMLGYQPKEGCMLACPGATQSVS